MSEFIVSSLKYRPNSFETVVGQEQVTKTLKNSIEDNKIPSAISVSYTHLTLPTNVAV